MPSSATTDLRRRLGPRGLFFAAALLLLSGLAPPFARAQEEAEEEDLTTGLAALTLHLNVGRQYFQELKYQEAIVELSAVVDAYEGGKIQELGEGALQSVAQALDLRARAYFNIGERERARGDFARLLRVKIDYQIDERIVSPKVVELFQQVRSENVGTLTVITDPPGAEASLNGDSIGKTPLLGRPVMQGTYKFRLSLKGYNELSEDLILIPKKEEKREFRLVPNRRVLRFITVPTGVNVFIDDQAVGTTFGNLSPERQSEVKDAGMDPAQASSPLLVSMVEAGPHKVRFEKECYRSDLRTINVTLDLERNDPQGFVPIELKQDIGQMKITSHPSGADVFIDGRAQGTTPLQPSAVCGGEREVRLVKKDEGAWFERVKVKPDVLNTLDVTLRPTLLYLGTFRLDEWGRLSWTDDDKNLVERMRTLRTVNQVRPSDNLRAFRSALEKELAPPAEAEKLKRGSGLPAARVLEALKTFEADLLMVVLVVQEPSARPVSTLLLYSREQPEPDRVPLDISRPEAIDSFLAAFDQEPQLSRPWIGATFADTLLEEGTVVVRVVKESPAATGGLLAGDQVVAVNGSPMASAQALEAAAAEWKAGDSVAVEVRRSGTPRTFNLTVSTTPVLLPLDSPDRLYNKALADYRQIARGDDHVLDRQLALLNLGIGFMHFRAYDRALSEALTQVNLPAGPGISRGTVRYFQGVCYLKKDLVPEARTAFQEAASAEDATLESNDGAPVSARAKNLLRGGGGT